MPPNGFEELFEELYSLEGLEIFEGLEGGIFDGQLAGLFDGLTGLEGIEGFVGQLEEQLRGFEELLEGQLLDQTRHYPALFAVEPSYYFCT